MIGGENCDFYYLFADVASLDIKCFLKKMVQICEMLSPIC